VAAAAEVPPEQDHARKRGKVERVRGGAGGMLRRRDRPGEGHVEEVVDGPVGVGMELRIPVRLGAVEVFAGEDLLRSRNAREPDVDHEAVVGEREQEPEDHEDEDSPLQPAQRNARELARLRASRAEDGVARSHEDVEEPERRDHCRPADAGEERASVEQRDRVEPEAREDEHVEVQQSKRPARIDERGDEEDRQSQIGAQLEELLTPHRTTTASDGALVTAQRAGSAALRSRALSAVCTLI